MGLILFNPAADLELPRGEKRLPANILAPEEVETVLAQPDISTPQGLRDRAILETLYATAIRRLELTRLSVFDLDYARRLLVVRGKGNKDRIVPTGERAGASALTSPRPASARPARAISFATPPRP